MRQAVGVLGAVCWSLIASGACGAEETPLDGLRAEHPRVLLVEEDFAGLEDRRPSDPGLDQTLTEIEAAAEAYLDAPLLERKQTGRRLLFVSREAIERITQLAIAYHTTGDRRYVRRVEAEMLNVCEFRDWNPDHFLDVAEMAAGVGLGYDWLYDELSDESREKIRQGLHDKALRFASQDMWWMRCDNNWNSVCFGGLSIAALAVAEDEPELAAKLLEKLKQGNPRVLESYQPDGVYLEGPAYWSYGTTYQVLLIQALRTALNDDLGLCTPALVASGGFVAHSTGPSGRVFNFADGVDQIGSPPALAWIAREAGMPDWSDAVERLAEDRPQLAASLPLRLLPAGEAGSADVPPLSWHGGGEQPVAMFRSSWTDPRAMYLAVKGGRASLNHGHMDAGSFVYEADGVRWAIDLGKVDYHTYEQRGIGLWDGSPTGDRWKMYPYINAAHNTVTIAGGRHVIDAQADITHYRPLREAVGEAEVDLSRVVPHVRRATRRFVFDAAQRRVTITDRLEGAGPGQPIEWVLLTRAKAAVEGRAVRLEQDGKTLRLESEGDAVGEWSAEPYAVPEGFYGDSEPEVTRVVWTAEAPESGVYDVTLSLDSAEGR